MAKDFIEILRDIRGKQLTKDLARADQTCIYGEISFMYDTLYQGETDYATMADNIDSINGVYDNISVITDLHADKAKFDSIFADKSKLDSIYSDKTTLDSIYADKAKLDSLFDDKATLDAVALNIAHIISVNNNEVNINSVNDNESNINSVNANEANINTVSASIDDVNTIASNMTDVTYFADVYQGPKATAPTTRNDGSPLQIGDLYLDISVVPNIMKDRQSNNTWSTVYSGDFYTQSEVNALTDLTTLNENLGNLVTGVLI